MKKKVFSWRNYVRTVAGDYNRFSDFLKALNDNADDVKHLVKKDSDYVADYDSDYDVDDYYTVVKETNNAVDNDLDKTTKANSIFDLLRVILEELN